MITIEMLPQCVAGLRVEDVSRWVELAWVRPERGDRGWLFHEIDVARVRLIQELHGRLQVNEDALPIVLSLLDQVYDLRRRMRELGEALGHIAPPEVRDSLVRHLLQRGS